MRWPTREVTVGKIGIGGKNPVRIQSMTTSDTRDIPSTIEQIIRLADAGCDLVRMTVQGKKEAEACERIKSTLIQKGYEIPLVADIHFYPPAAMLVAEFVDKVRINPGNFLDKRASFKEILYTDESYQDELNRIEEKFTPLVEKCKTLGRALRIGTNHGSLSDRILNRYGDTPHGMVESAFEYARICRKNDFHNFVFSMKSSNTKVMVQAYRLLVAEMEKVGWDYPLHLGVTEAGEGEDGRVKSAIGIGTLLLDGIGDTIRVSLTEDPWFEVDPCQRLAAITSDYQNYIPTIIKEKRPIIIPKKFPLHQDGSVGVVQKPLPPENPLLKEDFVLGENLPAPISMSAYKMAKSKSSFTLSSGFQSEVTVLVEEESEDDWNVLASHPPACILLKLPVPKARRFFEWLRHHKVQSPVLLNFSYDCGWEDLVIRASAECGSLLLEGYGEGLILEGPHSPEKLRELSFGILQGARMRSVKTEFISCPSCGRTLFSLQQVSERIRQRTEHLPGVKIAIMGCIVNGPGEMADADFGYVGSRPDKIDLYVGKECVEKNIDHADADERLIDLIKAHGRWVEPPAKTVQ